MCAAKSQKGNRMINPWILLPSQLRSADRISAAVWTADLGEAQQLRDERIATLARDGALRVTGKAIAEIDIKQVTIKQTLEREIREKPVYLDCRHTTDGLRTLSMPRSPDEPSPLVLASCPDLAPLSDDTFGATTMKLVEVAGQYRKCQRAAIGSK